MSLIFCNLNCKYQSEGYCRLDNVAKITNSSTNNDGGCAHFVKKKETVSKNKGISQ